MRVGWRMARSSEGVRGASSGEWCTTCIGRLGGGGGSKVKVEDSLVVGWFQSQVQSRIQECNVDVAPQ